MKKMLLLLPENWLFCLIESRENSNIKYAKSPYLPIHMFLYLLSQKNKNKWLQILSRLVILVQGIKT